MTTTTPTLMDTAPDGTHFRYLDIDFETSWTPAVEHYRRIVTDTGDLILTLQDFWDIEALRTAELVPGCSFGAFLDDEVLERWADGWSFSITDLNPVDALDKLVHACVLPTIAELPDKTLHQMVSEARDGARDPDTVPAYTLCVDGRAIRLVLVDLYDGPFTSLRALSHAIQRRTVA